MLKLSEEQARTFAEAVARARQTPGLVERVTALYAAVQAQIDLRKPRCDVSGRCCRFEEFGHRLFVTTLEVGVFVLSFPLEGEGRVGGGPDRASHSAQSSYPSPYPLPQGEGELRGCPYQVDGLCSVHTIRPFGCRIFFCDPTATDWQQEQYEHFHLRLREMHEQLGVPYLYVEWREALRAVGLGRFRT